MKSGFTLLELSIVLVIIGLIIGGVSVGRDLIYNTELKSTLDQVNQFNIATNTFRLKYNCLPGDCDNMTSYFTAGSQPEQVTDGDGNGKIAETQAVTPLENAGYGGWVGEAARYFDHLSAAGLIKEPQFDETDANTNIAGVGLPLMKSQSSGDIVSAAQVTTLGGIGVGYYTSYLTIRAGHHFRLGQCHYGPYGPATMGHGCGFNPADALYLDTKVDDGTPYSGNMYLTGRHTYTYRVPGASTNETNECGNSTTNTFRLTDTRRGCAVNWRAQF